MGRKTVAIEDRFWKSVDVRSADECWLWIRSLRGPGYGSAFINGHREDAHRVSWIIANGPIPDKLCVLHM